MPLRELWCRPFTDVAHTKQVLGKPLVRTLASLPSSPEEVDQVDAPMAYTYAGFGVLGLGFWCFGTQEF